MSERAPTPTASLWEIGLASNGDAEAVADAVRELLIELEGTPPDTPSMVDAARALIDNPSAGAVLVARSRGELVGLVAASWQTAIHVPGEYALIQDLWVRPDRRSRTLGAELLDALFALAREGGMARVEVGLPRESFERFAATEAFYFANGFTHNGPRMRRALT